MKFTVERVALQFLSSIGQSPLVQLKRMTSKDQAEVWVKYEGNNPTGSYKDRMVAGVLASKMARGELKEGDRICEYTGGSTGTSLAFASSILGLKFTAVTSNAFAQNKLESMRAFGAELVLVESEDSRLTPELFEELKITTMRMVEEEQVHYFDQFASPDVRPSYKGIGSEIVSEIGPEIDVYCAAVGTGGSLMGSRDGLFAAGAKPKVIALEPEQSPRLTRGHGGGHKIDGVALGFVPPFLDMSLIDESRALDQELAFETCRRLAREEGILAGSSTGLNVAAALEIASELGPGKRVVTIACDNGMKYFGGVPYSSR